MGYGGRVRLRWIRGVDNALGDAVSRNPVERAESRSRQMPVGPAKRVMDMMLEPAIRSRAEWDAFQHLIETLGGDDVNLGRARSIGRNDVASPRDHGEARGSCYDDSAGAQAASDCNSARTGGIAAKSSQKSPTADRFVAEDAGPYRALGRR